MNSQIFMDFSLLLFSCLFLQSISALQRADLTSLQLVQVLFRHGDRNPTRTYPGDPYKDQKKYFPEGYGQLTELGRAQTHDLGLYLRERYDGFISQNYNPYDLYVLSSDADRTVMSAKSLLTGFYPNKYILPKPSKAHIDENELIITTTIHLEKASGENTDISSGGKLLSPLWQIIPVHTIKKHADHIIRMTQSCPRYRELRDDFIDNSDIYRKLNQKYKGLVQYLALKSGIKYARNFNDILPLQDIFLVDRRHNLPLPEWANDTIYDKLQELQGLDFKYDNETPEMKRLRGGSLAKLILENFESKKKSALNLQNMFMFSSHDITISALMNILGIFDPQVPGYSTCLMIELHLDSVFNEYYVSVFYRNQTIYEPYEMKIPGCGDQCKLSDLERILTPYLPLDFKAECRHIRPADLDDNGFNSILVAGITFSLVFIFSTFLWVIISGCFYNHDEGRGKIWKHSYTRI